MATVNAQSCSIRELQRGKQVMNLLAVVTSFRSPAKTRGKDFSCCLELVDKSEKEINCMLFGSEESLPRVCPVGSVVCLKKFEITNYQGRPQLLVNTKRGCWAILAERSNGSIYVSSSNVPLSLSDSEGQRARTLKTWADTTSIVSGASKAIAGVSVAVPLSVPTCNFTNGISSSGTLSNTAPASSSTISTIAPFPPSSDDNVKSWLPVGGRVCPPKSTRHYATEVKTIDQLYPGMRNVGVCGVIKYYKPPAKSKGRDCYILVHMVDESSPSAGLTCIIFNPSMEKLAKMGTVGAVAIIKGVRVESNRETGSLQALGHEHTLVGVFSGKESATIPGQIGTWYILKNHEKKRLTELKLWLKREGLFLLSTRLGEVAVGCYFNTVCLVAAMAVLEERKLAVLSILDGTVMKPSSRELDPLKTKNKWEFDTAPKLFFLYRQFTRDVYVSNIEELDVSAGDTVYFKNLSCYQQPVTPTQVVVPAMATNVHVADPSLVELRLTGQQSGVVQLDEDCEEVVKLKESLLAVQGVLPSWRTPEQFSDIETSVDNTLPLATLDEIKEADEGTECLADVEVINVCPGTMDAICASFCPACYDLDNSCMSESQEEQSCSCSIDSSVLEYELTFSLRVRDESDELEVLVVSEEAKLLFSKLLGAKFMANDETKNKLLDLFYYMTGGNDPFFVLPLDPRYVYDRPSFRCAIRKCFNPSTAIDSEQLYSYHLVNTVIT